MALFKFLCSCGKTGAVFAARYDHITRKQKMCECGLEFMRSAMGPTATQKETLDNGLMPRSVERFCDIDRIMKERVLGADELAGQANYDPYAAGPPAK